MTRLLPHVPGVYEFESWPDEVIEHLSEDNEKGVDFVSPLQEKFLFYCALLFL